MDPSSRIYIAGHAGLAGSAICRRLQRAGFTNLITRTHAELDLCRQHDVEAFFSAERPEYVFLAAARVGGIAAHAAMPAEFLHDNLALQNNVIHSAWKYGAKKLLFVASSAIYPRDAPQPLREDSLLTGPLEPSVESYAVAKIAGLRMAQAYRRQYGFKAITAVPTNLYGPGDHFDASHAHVLAALLRRFTEAAASGAPHVTVWGSGDQRREFLHVDDLADALLFLMLHYDGADIVNVGTGSDVSIRELAGYLARVTGFKGRILFDTTKPDGAPRKQLDVSRLAALGWRASIALDRGLEQTYRWYTASGSVTAV